VDVFQNQTTLHPLGLLAVAILGVAVLLLPRRYAMVPMLVMACFISPAQRIVVLSLDFSLFRLLILFGWARILLFGVEAGFRWKPIDSVMTAWVLCGLAMATLREGTAAELTYRLGLAFDAAGTYFLVRLLLRDLGDVLVLARAAALLSLPVAATFVLEHLTGRNMFAIFGGVAEWTEVRDGRVRCRGPFAHPIYAGCFWATWLPLILALWRDRREARWLAPAGLAAVAVITYTSASSTPVLAVVLAVVALAAYPWRRHTRALRWSVAGGLVVLHFAMNAPVWHLISRVDVLAGSTGWYRYRLIDGFIRNVDQWWLAGTRAYDSLWGPTYKAVTNQYVLEGVEGGLLTLTLFVAMIVLGFRAAGRLVRSRDADGPGRLMAWALGAAFLVHAIDFLAVSYFGQVLIAWYLALGILARLDPGPVPVPAPRPAAVRTPPRVLARPTTS
jgi:hypothetical protein